MQIIILTGMSGAGKSHALEALEDIGYYCIDNMPPILVGKFVELMQSQGKISKIAIVTDIRGGALFEGFISCVTQIKSNSDTQCKVFFLDADDKIIIRRYKETRRKHPLQDDCTISLADAIKNERKMLKEIRSIADVVIDSSMLSATQLKNQVGSVFVGENKGFSLSFVSFGFKYGILTEADLVFDARCLPNPFYIEELKHKRGTDKDVYDYVFGNDSTNTYVAKIKDMLTFLIPLFIEEGKASVVVGIGCTGGKHRSVAICEHLSNYYKDEGYFTTKSHRDFTK